MPKASPHHRSFPVASAWPQAHLGGENLDKGSVSGDTPRACRCIIARRVEAIASPRRQPLVGGVVWSAESHLRWGSYRSVGGRLEDWLRGATRLVAPAPERIACIIRCRFVFS